MDEVVAAVVDGVEDVPPPISLLQRKRTFNWMLLGQRMRRQWRRRPPRAAYAGWRKKWLLQNTFIVKHKPHVEGDGFTVECSTLTGPQSLKFLGCTAKQLTSMDTPPYVSVVHAALGECDHPTSPGSMDSTFCFVCNVKAVLHMFSKRILPVLQAQTVTEFALAQVEGGVFCPEAYDIEVKAWGRLLVHTFFEGGSRSIISDYCMYYHLIIITYTTLISLFYSAFDHRALRVPH